jgi:arylsulfatase A-like enzyme
MTAFNAERQISRRGFMGLVAGAAALPALPAALCQGQRSAPAPGGDRSQPGAAGPQRPNLVFIVADDLGWADIGFHGSEIETPNIDRLVREGVRFTHHYVMATCTPTRVGLMTGRYPSRYGVTSPAYGKIFDDDTVTLAEALRRGGYATSISGKWHMGSPPDWTPRKYGFESSYGYFHGQVDPYVHDYKTGVPTWHRNDRYVEEKGHATDLITDEAVRVIESKHDKPFFLYVTYSVPHHPLDEPSEWTARYEGRIAEPSRRWFAASVTHMDHGIGRIVAAIDRRGLRRNTLIVFSSDNGGQTRWSSDKEYKGRYADKPHTVLGNNRPLRGWKGELYEGGIRVPALANWPGVLKAGESKAPVHIVDWMPTLCALTGCSPARDLAWDGSNIWPAVRGETASAAPRSFYWKTPNSFAVRRGDWKLIVGKSGREAQLYDMASDPYETRDQAAQHPERVAELRALLKEYTAKDR